MKIVVILPTYNERENIRTLLDKIFDSIRSIRQHTFSVLIVDDNSPDGTADVVKDYQKTNKNVSLITGEKKGLGKAILRGMNHALTSLSADIIIHMDADLSHDPKVIPDLVKTLDTGADMVVGSRYITNGSIPDNWGLHRKIFSIAGNSIVRFGLGFPSVHDWTGGYRCIRSEFVKKIKDEMNPYSGYVFQIAFLHKALKQKADIREVPIHFADRKYGKSKIAPTEYIRNVLIYVLSSRFSGLFSNQFKKFAIVGGIGFLINTILLEVFVRFGAHPAIASIIGAEFAIISNFILNNSWTFRTKKIEKNSWLPKFLQFNFTSIGAMIIQASVVALGVHFFDMSYYRVFYIIGVGFGLIWNYWMYSNVIWKKT